MTYPPPGPWQQPEPPPEGDPVYVPQPYPYANPATQQPYGYPYPPQPYGYPYPYAPQPIPPARVAVPAVGWALAGIAVLIFTSAFLTWATVLGLSIKGTDSNGDGVATRAFAVVIAAMGIVIVCRQGRIWTSILACVFASLTALIAFVDIGDVTSVANDAGFDTSGVHVGIGLWFTAFGAVLAVGFSIAGMVRRAPQPS